MRLGGIVFTTHDARQPVHICNCHVSRKVIIIQQPPEHIRASCRIDALHQSHDNLCFFIHPCCAECFITFLQVFQYTVVLIGCLCPHVLCKKGIQRIPQIFK